MMVANVVFTNVLKGRCIEIRKDWCFVLLLVCFWVCGVVPMHLFFASLLGCVRVKCGVKALGVKGLKVLFYKKKAKYYINYI